MVIQIYNIMINMFSLCKFVYRLGEKIYNIRIVVKGNWVYSSIYFVNHFEYVAFLC